MASARSAPPPLTSSRLSERSERSSRSELATRPWDRAPQGSRRSRPPQRSVAACPGSALLAQKAACGIRLCAEKRRQNLDANATRPQAANGGGWKPRYSASSHRAKRRHTGSASTGPQICAPIGSPSFDRPSGTAVAGKPHRLV